MKKLTLIFSIILTFSLILIFSRNYLEETFKGEEKNIELDIEENINKETNRKEDKVVIEKPITNYISLEKYEEQHIIKFIETNEEDFEKTFESIGITVDSSKVSFTKKEPTYSINEEILDSFLEELNKNRIDKVYPELKLEGTILTATAYHDGNLLDLKALKEYILDNKNENYLRVILDNFIVKYEEEKPSDVVKRMEETINKFTGFEIEYINGETIVITNFLDFIEVENNEVIYKFDTPEFNSYLKEIVEDRTNSYNTYYNDWNFTTTDGEEIKISKHKRNFEKGVYGSKVDIENEMEYIREKLLTLSSEKERKPIFLVENGFEIGNSYIEVSIDKQHVWVYKDGELLMDSNCVTGNYNSMDTPTGVYQIIDQFHHAYFPTGGHSYNWMKFTSSGHGLHDATWRKNKEFENVDTYKGNGSHGCINLPLDFSEKLYEIVKEGDIVVIY